MVQILRLNFWMVQNFVLFVDRSAVTKIRALHLLIISYSTYRLMVGEVFI